MLVLTRKPGETIRIDGSITVRITKIHGNRVRIGIEAPKDVPVHREEVFQRIQSESELASRKVLVQYLRDAESNPVRRGHVAG